MDNQTHRMTVNNTEYEIIRLLEKINREMDDLYAFYDYRNQVFDMYAEIDQSPVSDNLSIVIPAKLIPIMRDL